MFDLAYLQLIPNMIIAAPMNEIQLRNLMYTAQIEPKGPFAIRYPKGNAQRADWEKDFEKMDIGKGRILSEGNEVAVLTIGATGIDAQKTVEKLKKEGINITHADIIFLKPLDEDLLHDICKNHTALVTVEDGTVKGGFGTAVAEVLIENNYQIPLKRLGVPDSFVEHGTVEELKHELGYDAEGIEKVVIQLLKSINNK